MGKFISSIKNPTRARNAEHYRLQLAIIKSVTAEFITKYQLDAPHAAYVKAFENEDSIYLQSRGFVDTKVLAAKDAERDKLYRFVSQTVRSKKLSIEAAEAEAAEKLAFVLKPYGKMIAKPDAENTANVVDLVKKLESSDYSQYVETLNLTKVVATLKAVNLEYDDLYSHRADEKRVRGVSEGLRSARKKVDIAFAEFANAINAVYTVNALGENDATKEAEIGAVINAINSEILQFTETLARRGIGKKSVISQGETPKTDAGADAGTEAGDESGDNTPEYGTDADGHPTVE